MTDLIHAAFTALGPAASPREVEFVTAGLRAAGDAETVALLDAAATFSGGNDGFERLKAIATETKAGAFVALDLAVEWRRPGYWGDAIARSHDEGGNGDE